MRVFLQITENTSHGAVCAPRYRGHIQTHLFPITGNSVTGVLAAWLNSFVHSSNNHRNSLALALDVAASNDNMPMGVRLTYISGAHGNVLYGVRFGGFVIESPCVEELVHVAALADLDVTPVYQRQGHWFWSMFSKTPEYKFIGFQIKSKN